MSSITTAQILSVYLLPNNPPVLSSQLVPHPVLSSRQNSIEMAFFLKARVENCSRAVVDLKIYCTQSVLLFLILEQQLNTVEGFAACSLPCAVAGDFFTCRKLAFYVGRMTSEFSEQCQLKSSEYKINSRLAQGASQICSSWRLVELVNLNAS